MKKKINYPKAGFSRRMAALVYDGLMIGAIEMTAAGVVIAVLEALVAAGLLQYAPYQDASDMLTKHPQLSHLFTFYLGAIWIGFFAYFWCKGGQTVGMRAWKLRVQREDGSLITPTQALIRIGTSAFGLSNIMALFGRDKLGFHDIMAKTEVVVLPE